MGIENWVPDEGERIISARVPKELMDFVDGVAMEHACNRTDAIIMLLNYARACDETYRLIQASRRLGKIPFEATLIAMEKLARLSNPVGKQSKRMKKEKTRLAKSVENRIHPAMIDAGRDAGR